MKHFSNWGKHKMVYILSDQVINHLLMWPCLEFLALTNRNSGHNCQHETQDIIKQICCNIFGHWIVFCLFIKSPFKSDWELAEANLINCYRIRLSIVVIN